MSTSSRRKRRTKEHPKVGETILLASKASYHEAEGMQGKVAVVVESQRYGPWMTVKVLDPLEQIFKWRKGSFKRIPIISRRDYDLGPFCRLDDPTLVLIFSFLGGGVGDCYMKKEKFFPLKSAGQLYFTLSSVCKKWQEVCLRNFAEIAGFVDADFLSLGEVEKDCADWMCFHKLMLGRIRLFCKRWFNESFNEVLRVIQACNTENTNLVECFENRVRYRLCRPHRDCEYNWQQVRRFIAENCPNAVLIQDSDDHAWLMVPVA